MNTALLGCIAGEFTGASALARKRVRDRLRVVRTAPGPALPPPITHWFGEKVGHVPLMPSARPSSGG